MNRRPFLLSCLMTALLLAVSLSSVRADDPRDADVTKDMAKLKTAMVGQDQAGLINMMYKPIVDAAGGRDKLLAQTKQLATMIQTTSFDAGKPYQYFAGKDNDYVIVPTDAHMTIKGQKYESISFELGTKPHGTNAWQYVDGAGITPQVRTMFFADLPATATLPPHSIKPAAN